jgi:hypothetical protein
LLKEDEKPDIAPWGVGEMVIMCGLSYRGKGGGQPGKFHEGHESFLMKDSGYSAGNKPGKDPTSLVQPLRPKAPTG